MRGFILLLFCLSLAPIIQAQAQPPAKNPAAEVESLMKERRDALQKLVRILDSQYRMGTVDFNRVASAASKLADMELELAKTKDERIAACRKQVELCRDAEKLCQARVNAGTATEADVYEAKAERLKAEIHLAREKAGDKPTAN